MARTNAISNLSHAPEASSGEAFKSVGGGEPLSYVDAE